MELGKESKLSLIGISGKDIYDENKTLVLGIILNIAVIVNLS